MKSILHKKNQRYFLLEIEYIYPLQPDLALRLVDDGVEQITDKSRAAIDR